MNHFNFMSLPIPQHFRKILLVLAVLGFLGINVPFLYYALIDTETYTAGMHNGLALLFIVEAFLLMGFFAAVIAIAGFKRPGWLSFIGLTLIGSLAFSIPLFLFLASRPREESRDEPNT